MWTALTNTKEVVKGEDVALTIEPGMNILEVNNQLAEKNIELLRNTTYKP